MRYLKIFLLFSLLLNWPFSSLASQKKLWRKIKTPNQRKLFSSADSEDLDGLIEALRKDPSDLYTKTFYAEDTILHVAIRKGHLNIIRFLLKHYASYLKDIKNNYGCFPLHLAICTWNNDILDLVLKANPQLDAKNGYGATALHLAAQNGFTEGIKRLLKAGANINSQDINKCTPLMLAEERGHNGSAEFLAKKK